MPSKVYVTGSSGFLGSATVRDLRSRGCCVVALSRTDGADDYAGLDPDDGSDLVHLAECADIARAKVAGEAHLAGVTTTCRTLLAKPWRRVVYASSAVVYGDACLTARRVGEPTAADPGWYQRGKLECEALVTAAGGVVARFSNLIGPGMATNNVLSDILAQVGTAGPLKIRDGAAVRDFLSATDAARGIHAALAGSDDCCRGRIFNFGTGNGCSAADIAALVLRIAGEPSREVQMPPPKGQPSHLVLDISATTAALGWTPGVGLEAAVAELLRMKETSCAK